MQVTRTVVLAAASAVISVHVIAFTKPVGGASSSQRLEMDDLHAPLVKDTSPPAGDADGDGVPDTQDMCCRTPLDVPVDANGRPLGDFDLDCDVDHADFSVFQRAFTGQLERCSLEICDNGMDDDSDGFTDCDDWDCDDAPACSREICDNGTDDDGDEFIDCSDFDCLDDPACATEICDNGLDDDYDGFIDCDDFDCLEHLACTSEICDNEADDDHDGFIDCDDWDCSRAPACVGEICDNGVDDDDDAFIDCADFDCLGNPACP